MSIWAPSLKWNYFKFLFSCFYHPRILPHLATFTPFINVMFQWTNQELLHPVSNQNFLPPSYHLLKTNPLEWDSSHGWESFFRLEGVWPSWPVEFVVTWGHVVHTLALIQQVSLYKTPMSPFVPWLCDISQASALGHPNEFLRCTFVLCKLR